MNSSPHSPIIQRFFDLMEGKDKRLVADVFSPDAAGLIEALSIVAE